MQINGSAVKIADSQLCFKVPTTHPYLHERHALTVASLYVKGPSGRTQMYPTWTDHESLSDAMLVLAR